MVRDTKPIDIKCCSRCGETKDFDKFIKKRNICKECDNKRHKERYKAVILSNEIIQTCISCNKSKTLDCFLKTRKLCKDCNNEKRRDKYKNDEDHRLKIIKTVTEFKHNKCVEKRRIKQEIIGENNKKCSCCDKIKSKENFRHNRLKCKICERDDPLCKFIRNIRSRIYIALKQQKDKHTIEYLGCGSTEYLEWILDNDKSYTLENSGKLWHIDHVIPLSKFDLDDKQQQTIAFNWRNTMPLSVKENLSKNNKILKTQIEEHYNHLLQYHKEKNIEMPQEFIDLFAKYLVAGNPLEPLLPLTDGNIREELG